MILYIDYSEETEDTGSQGHPVQKGPMQTDPAQRDPAHGDPVSDRLIMGRCKWRSTAGQLGLRDRGVPLIIKESRDRSYTYVL